MQILFWWNSLVVAIIRYIQQTIVLVCCVVLKSCYISLMGISG